MQFGLLYMQRCTYIAQGAAPGLRLETGLVGTADLWATSFLPAGCARPARPADYDAMTEGASYLHEWTCMYAASRLSDGDVATAWAEGANGDGIGEIVLLPIDTSKPIRIRAGFAKSAALYAANNRPENIKLYVLSVGAFDATQSGAIYENLRVVLTHSVRLADRNEFQTVTPPRRQSGQRSVSVIKFQTASTGASNSQRVRNWYSAISYLRPFVKLNRWNARAACKTAKKLLAELDAIIEAGRDS